MAKYASKILNQARNWLGYKESNGTHRKIIDLYNSHKPLARNYKVKYNDEWCATFVSALAIKCGYTSIIPTECSCEMMIRLFKEKGCWCENEKVDPEPGDIIFYDWQDNGVGDNIGWSDHVGIVEKVSGRNITVIEGNKGEEVGRRVLPINSRYIRGYGVPKYDAEPKAKPKKTVEQVAQEIVKGIGNWGDGETRKKRVKDAGLDYNKVQARVNQILSKKTTKSIDTIAREVREGKWGIGEARKKALEKAGYDYDKVQKKVNEYYNKHYK